MTPLTRRPLTPRPDALRLPRRSPAIEHGGVATDPLDKADFAILTTDPCFAAVYAATRQPFALSPERRLQWEVFMAAWDDLHRRHAASAARRWFAADEPDWPCSLVSICDSFKLDPDAVRAAAQRHAESGPPRRLSTRERLVAWADRQREPWTVQSAALALNRSTYVIGRAVRLCYEAGEIVRVRQFGPGWSYAAADAERGEVA